VVNVGVRPTFDGATRLVEAHLLDAAPDLYGRRLALAFLGRIRSERRFDSLEALRSQIADDVAMARRVLGPAP
jgi:riboflavin kinase/FMN adenylyltransferase